MATDEELNRFVFALVKADQAFFEKVKVMFLAMNCDNPKMYAFLSTAFRIAERYRPKMIEMKCES